MILNNLIQSSYPTMIAAVKIATSSTALNIAIGAVALAVLECIIYKVYQHFWKDRTVEQKDTQKLASPPRQNDNSETPTRESSPKTATPPPTDIDSPFPSHATTPPPKQPSQKVTTPSSNDNHSPFYSTPETPPSAHQRPEDPISPYVAPRNASVSRVQSDTTVPRRSSSLIIDQALPKIISRAPSRFVSVSSDLLEHATSIPQIFSSTTKIDRASSTLQIKNPSIMIENSPEENYNNWNRDLNGATQYTLKIENKQIGINTKIPKDFLKPNNVGEELEIMTANTYDPNYQKSGVLIYVGLPFLNRAENETHTDLNNTSISVKGHTIGILYQREETFFETEAFGTKFYGYRPQKDFFTLLDFNQIVKDAKQDKLIEMVCNAEMTLEGTQLQIFLPTDKDNIIVSDA